MKTLVIRRGASPDPYTLENGDVYDSTGELIEVGETLWQSNHVNTDSTINYHGGKLAPVDCLGMVGYKTSASGKRTRAILLFHLLKPSDPFPVSQVHVTEEMKILPSLIPNPNHNNEKWMSHIWVHPGGLFWDWSEGCQTVLEANPDYEFTCLMSHLVDNEVINFKLIGE
jgi:hypothetical protein